MRTVAASEKGFTVTEMVMVAGAMCFLWAGLGLFVGDLMRSQKSTSRRGEVAVQQGQILSLLASGEACARNFGGLGLNVPRTLVRLLDRNGQPFVRNMIGPQDPIGPRTMTLRADPSDPTTIARLEMTYEIAGEIAVQPFEVRLPITLDDAGLIASCSTAGTSKPELDLTKTSCPSNRVMQGFDANGDPLCVSGPSQCNGSLARDTELSAAPDAKQDLMGLLCGQQSGKALTCVSCIAQWMYTAPFDGQAHCRCI